MQHRALFTIAWVALFIAAGDTSSAWSWILLLRSSSVSGAPLWYTDSLDVPQKKKSKGLRSGDLAGHGILLDQSIYLDMLDLNTAGRAGMNVLVHHHAWILLPPAGVLLIFHPADLEDPPSKNPHKSPHLGAPEIHVGRLIYPQLVRPTYEQKICFGIDLQN